MPAPTFIYLTDVHFGNGKVSVIPELCESLNIVRPLLVTDQGLVGLGLPDHIPIEPTAVFADVPSNPTEDSVLKGLEVYRGADCDGIIALGGGSPIDCAKAISILATHAGPLQQYALVHGGDALITANKPPLIAVPTTAGTGTEVGRGALITMRSGRKLGVIGKYVLPQAAVCDPELTLGLPPLLTAATGLDAISHCVETYCSPLFNPVADAIALDGLYRAWNNLPRVLDDPDNLDCRGEMMMASTQGALAFQKGLGLIHSLSHPLGALTGKQLHHGTLNAVFMPHVIRFNADACAHKINGMAHAMGVSENGEAVAAAFFEMNQKAGLPLTLREMGVTEEDLDGIAEAAMDDHSTPTNPRPLSLEDCTEVLRAAF